MKEYAERFYKSRRWQETRDAYAKSVGGLCEDCLNHGNITPGEIVHHMRPINEKNINDPKITLSWSNLRLLCSRCHSERHKKSHKRYYFDEQGHCVPVDRE